MNESNRSTMNARVEELGAELTDAAYPVMLRHGAVDNWLDLELDLWKALREAVKEHVTLKGEKNGKSTAA